jgi:hypothetical protein
MNTLWKGIRNEIKCDSLRATDIYGNIHGPTSNNIPAGITGATGYFGYFHSITGQINNFYSYTGDIDTLYSNTIYAATGEIGTLYSNTIYANTGDIGTLISDRIVSPTGDIGTLYSNTIYAATGEIGTLISDRIVSPTGEIGTLYSNTIYVATGIYGKDITATGIISAATGSFGNISASSGIYSASSFTRDQSTGITVPNISSMYQYYAVGPVTIPISNQSAVFLNNSSLTGMTGTKGALIPASSFSVGSVFEFYFAGSFKNSVLYNAKNFGTGNVSQQSPAGSGTKIWYGDNNTIVFTSELQQSATRITMINSTGTLFDNTLSTGDPDYPNYKQIIIQNINNKTQFQIWNISTISNYGGTFTEFRVTLDNASGSDFLTSDTVLFKYVETVGPSINVGLTFHQNEATYDSTKAICAANLQNTIDYTNNKVDYTKKHSFTIRSVFKVINNDNTNIIVASSNSGIILRKQSIFNSNVSNKIDTFNIFEKNLNSASPFTKSLTDSNSVYPHVMISSFAQSIDLEVNDYYLRRIA